MAGTSIEWATDVWNPVTGCDRVSPGCAHCYALTYAGRLKAMGQPKYQADGGRASGPGFGVTVHADELEAPLRWRKPRRVFVNSMSDLFHEAVPENFIQRVFAVMALASRHQFLVLTKRPERMREIVSKLYEHPMREHYATRQSPALSAGVFDPFYGMADWTWIETGPVPNVWLGVSIENRRFVWRADVLRRTPAAVRFVSAEPLLGPLVGNEARETYLCECGQGDPAEHVCCSDCGDDSPGCGCCNLDLAGIDWLIVGGESGHGHRPMNLDWVRDLRDAAVATGTAFFYKQQGGRTPKAGGRELDGRSWDEMPATRAGRVA